MADILIRMEMPKTCEDCPIYDSDYGICNFLSVYYPEGSEDRINGCPLHELPEHGDLISKPALFDEVFKVWGVEYAESDCNMLMDLINDAPVIVPAERRER